MYNKILVPVDDSEKSFKAAQYAADLASKSGSAITVMHVLPLAKSEVDTSCFSPDRYGNIQQSIEEEYWHRAQETLKKVIEELSGYKLNVTTEVATGYPADEICKKVKEGGYDLLIMGSRGLGDFKGFIKGSVSNRVSRRAECPVLIVR